MTTLTTASTTRRHPQAELDAMELDGVLEQVARLAGRQRDRKPFVAALAALERARAALIEEAER